MMLLISMFRRWVMGVLVVGLSGMALGAVPAAPTNLSVAATSATGTTATMSFFWDDTSTNEVSWRLELSSNGGASYTTLISLGSSSSAATGRLRYDRSSSDLPSLLINTTYSFRVFAVNADGSSAASNVATVVTALFSAPTNLVVTAVDPFQVTMRWRDNSTSDEGFAVERKAGSGEWAPLGTVSSGTTYLAPLVLMSPSGTFSFRVRAFRGTEVTAFSNEVTVNSAAFGLTVTPVSGQTRLGFSWPDVVGEQGYQISFRAVGFSQYSQLAVVAANVTSYQSVNGALDPGVAYELVVSPITSSGGFYGDSSVATATADGVTSKVGGSGVPGVGFSHSFTQFSNAAVTARALSGVPAGMSFNATSGVLSGNLPAVGNYFPVYTVTLAGGAQMTQTFSLRVRPAAGAPVVGTVIPAWTATVGQTRDTAVAGTFLDAEAESAVRVSTTLGDMDFILFNGATPATVANFMSYVNAGRYSDVVFHRSIPGFVVQGGGFKGAGTGSNFTSVVTNAPVVNEPGIENVRGTVSMAKLGGDPNSATSQFFVSLADNRSNLDFQNGGFTVFGRVAGQGMAVMDALAGLPRNTYNLFLNGGAVATPFSDFPMNVVPAPSTMDQTRLVKMNSVTPIATLSYGVVANSNPAVATAVITGGQLRLTAVAGGTTTVTVGATDLDLLTASQAVAVTVNDTFATWAGRQQFPGGMAGALQDPDWDGLSNLQEYALFGNPAAAGTSPVAAATGAGGLLTVTFPVRKFTQGLEYAVEASNTLAGAWTTVWTSAAGFSNTQVVAAVDQADRVVVTVRDVAGNLSRRFLRVRVSQQ